MNHAKTAVIFDMDGVVSDTQHFHAQVESELLRRFGVHMPPEQITAQYAGVATEVWFADVLASRHKEAVDIQSILFEKWELMRKMAKGSLQEVPGATNLIQQLKKHNLKLAIASSSTKAFIRDVLSELRLHQFFDATVSAQEVLHGKPAPDIFLLAAERLETAPDQAVVIEDGRSGMIGASAAGMKSIGLVANTSEDYPATLLVSALDEITILRIQAL